MKKIYKMIEGKTLAEMHRCFGSGDEFSDFVSQLELLAKEVEFLGMLRNKVSDDEAINVVMKEVCIITLFYHQNMEIIRELIKKLESREVDEDEMNRMDSMLDS